MKTHLLLTLTVILSVSGCSSYRVPRDRVAITGHSTLCEGEIQMLLPEAGKVATEVMATPGHQELQVVARGHPFVAEDSPTPAFAVCADHARYKVRFDATGGERMRFYLDESARGSPELSVWRQIEPGNPKSEPIPAQVQLLEKSRRCTLSDLYRECPTVMQ